MIWLRTSSVAPCSDRARRNCVDWLASSRICGASPLVETVIWRGPVPRAPGALLIRIARRRIFLFGGGRPPPPKETFLDFFFPLFFLRRGGLFYFRRSQLVCSPSL